MKSFCDPLLDICISLGDPLFLNFIILYTLFFMLAYFHCKQHVFDVICSLLCYRLERRSLLFRGRQTPLLMKCWEL